MTLPPHGSSSQVDLRGGPRKKMLVVGAVAVVALGAGAAGMIGFQEDSAEGSQASAPDAAAGFNYGEYAGSIENLRTILKHRPCDAKNAIELGETLNRAGDHEGAIEYVDEFIEECGELRRILWVKVAANEDLERWDRVAEVTTTLIAGAAHDSDYWWWRGRAHENQGEAEKAASDYRHSVARGPNKYGSSRFAKLVREEEPCEGAFAMSSYLARLNRAPPPWARRDFQELYLAGDCDGLAGRGRAEVTFAADAPVIKAQVEVNGARGRFVVDSEAAFLTLRRSFADEIEVAGEGGASIYLFGDFADASLGSAERVKLGRATASEVSVAIVEELPGDADGVVGQSFLWRFRPRWEEERLILEPLAP